VYQRITENWAGFLATLSDEQTAFANELLTAATDPNRAEIDRQRTAAVGEERPRGS
jgi:hypothetical protein